SSSKGHVYTTNEGHLIPSIMETMWIVAKMQVHLVSSCSSSLLNSESETGKGNQLQ
ncbi:mCG145288, partial [Mus musculus]